MEIEDQCELGLPHDLFVVWSFFLAYLYYSNMCSYRFIHTNYFPYFLCISTGMFPVLGGVILKACGFSDVQLNLSILPGAFVVPRERLPGNRRPPGSGNRPGSQNPPGGNGGNGKGGNSTCKQFGLWAFEQGLCISLYTSLRNYMFLCFVSFWEV